MAYVDVDTLGGIPEKKQEDSEKAAIDSHEIAETVQELVTKSEASGPDHRLPVNLPGYEEQSNSIHPAQIAFLSPDVPATLILNQIK